MTTINWGILGAGNISAQFVFDLLLSNSRKGAIIHVVKSIGCSLISKGEQFIKECGITKENNDGVIPTVESYKDFYNDKSIDIVYVGTPHAFHHEQVIQCLNNDHHVLCEKPMTINAKESEELFTLAKSKKKMLMEAVWTRFLPIVQEVKTKIDNGTIGDVFRVFADLSFDADLPNCPPTSRIRDRNLGGGALLDIGIYPLTYSRVFLETKGKLGKNHSPFEIKSVVTVDPVDKVDFNTSIIVKYENGKHGVLTCSNYGPSPIPFGRIEGTKGFIELYAENPARLQLYKVVLRNGDSQEFKDDTGYNGFIHEANAIAQDVFDGKLENDIMPHDETLLVMGLMDNIRKEYGFKYPKE